jgi:hypothetical protein
MKPLRIRRDYCLAAAALAVALGTAARLEAADMFSERFQPFAEKYCVRCHNTKQARGELDLTRYTEARHVTADFRRWNNVIEFIRDGEMPPEDEPQPTLEERKQVTESLEAILLDEAKKHAGDPGVILPRRLSNTEYDRSIRDLTGVDIRPTRDFPPDPAAGEGFDNTGEALGMSPSLLKKYLLAAQHISEHMVLKTDGISFAPFPVTSYNEQKKLTEQAIIDFYQSHAVRIADYLEAAWRYRHRGESDRAIDIAMWAERRGLSGKYLALVSETLNEASAESAFAPRKQALSQSERQLSDFMKQIGQLWNSIPAPTEAVPRPSELLTLQRSIEFWQRKLCYREESLIRSNAGNWPIGHLDFRARTAAQRDQFDPSNFKSRATVRFDRLKAPKENEASAGGMTLNLIVDRAFDDGQGGVVIMHRPIFSKSNNLPRNADEAVKDEVVTLRAVLERHAPAIARRLSFGKHPGGDEIDADSFAVQAPVSVEIPLSVEALRQLNDKQLLVDCELDRQDRERSVYIQLAKPLEVRYAANVELLIHADSDLAKNMAESAARFCRAFPNRFFYVDNERGLAAGFHLVDGFFRDDRPLMEKVLDQRQQRELDGLWRELDFVTQSTETLIRGFVWFERSERHVLHDARFDFLRAEDPQLVQDELLTRFEKVYLGKMGVKLIDDTLQPEKPSDQYDLIHGFFMQIREGLARYREQLQAAEQKGLADLNDLAQRAYRRSLRDTEIESLRTLYQSLRERGQGVEAALRGVFTAVLMSPDFFFHFTESPRGPGVHPLSDDDLASRLSYFLWSSLPDEELRAAARAGKLQDEATLLAQMRRMLNDPRIDAFAREFFGQWLRYRDYLSKDAINAESFPGYDDQLREAMFDEPVRLAMYLIQEDKPITDLLNSDVTFVNGVLAKHYGGEIARQYNSRSTNPAQWHRVDGLRDVGRGGLFGMGVILTKTSKAERTSPVKRGFWAVHHLLGQHFPPPPADVAELPPNEKQATKTIRELIVAHTANPKCAMCHTHFDSLGMTLEGFDPIGRARTKDLAGRPIDDVALLPSGETARGIPGLIEYIEQHRRQDFVRTLCRKFLGYALGRSVLLSDQPLLMEMEEALQKNDYRFSVLFETVVLSPQFRKQRGSE